MQTSIRKNLNSWYDKDFKPYMGRLIRGLRGKDIPAKNSEPYATYKETGMWTDRKGRERPYNIIRTSSHSLGEVGKRYGRHAHSPGQLYRGAMNVKPDIIIKGTTIELKARFEKPFYLPIVHDGLYNLKLRYPFVDAAIGARFERLPTDILDGILLAWEI